MAEEGCRVGPSGLRATLRCPSLIAARDRARPWSQRVGSAGVGSGAGKDGHQGGRGSRSCGKRARAWRQLTGSSGPKHLSSCRFTSLFPASWRAGVFSSAPPPRPALSLPAFFPFLPVRTLLPRGIFELMGQIIILLFPSLQWLHVAP